MKRWIFHSKVEEGEKLFPNISPLLAQLLVNRGLTSLEAIAEFLHPSYNDHLHDPFLFRDMEKAVRRIEQAIDGREAIRLYGDYDVDGVSALAVLFSTFRALGVDGISVRIPDRYKDGYGLNAAAIQQAVADGVKLLITCDCGTSNSEEVRIANEAGIDVIVVDHHQEPPVLPAALAILNPSFTSEPYPTKKLCSGAVAFKLATALLRHLEYGKGRLEKPLPLGWEKWLLDLVALATVADMMPLMGENRVLVKHGLTVLRKSPRIGLQELAKVMGTTLSAVTTVTIGFQIAPRLNAAGRLKHADTAFKLLTTEDVLEAATLAAELQGINQERQRLTSSIYQEALAQFDGPITSKLLVAHGKGWSSGVIGLVAGKLKELFHRPVLAIGEEDGKLVGSGRSVPGFDITAALVESGEYLAKFGGHPMACGFTVQSPEHLEGFVNTMRAIADRELANNDLQAELRIDAELSLAKVSWELIGLLEQLEPFGIAVPEPIFATRNVKIGQPERVGSDGKHLRLFFSDRDNLNGRAIGFGMGEWAERLKSGEHLDLAYRVGVNEWNGDRRLQLTLVDLQPST